MDEEIGNHLLEDHHFEVIEPEMIQIPLKQFQDLLRDAKRPAVSPTDLDRMIANRLAEVIFKLINQRS